MSEHDRLRHIDDQTFSLFVILEEEIRKYFSIMKQESILAVIQTFLHSTDLGFQWCIFASETDDEVAELVLCQIVATLRGTVQTGSQKNIAEKKSTPVMSCTK